MKIAFDFGGVLSRGGQIVEMLHAFQSAGHDVHLISTVGSEEEGAGRRAALTAVNVAIPTDNMHIIVDSTPEYHSRYKSHGEAKAAIMRRIGCNILFDDSEHVIAGVVAAGFIGLHVRIN